MWRGIPDWSTHGRGVTGHVILVNFDLGNATVRGNPITAEKLDELACDALT